MSKTVPARYVHEVQRAFGTWAAWPPDVAVTIGSIGQLRDGIFCPEATLADFGWPVDIEVSPGTSDRFYATNNAVHMTVSSGSATAVPTSATIRFSRGSAVLVALSSCKTVRPKTPLALLASIGQLNDQNRWNTDWHVVASLTMTSGGLVAISKQAGAELEIALSSGASILQEALLGSASIKISRTDSLAYYAALQGPATPLFTLQRLVRRRGQTVLRQADGARPPLALGASLRNVDPPEAVSSP